MKRYKALFGQVAVWTVIVAGFLVCWEALVRFGPLSRLVASPSAVLGWSVQNYNSLWMHTLVTLKETLYGFSIAFILSITFGIVIDAVPPIKRGAMAVLAASNGIPKVVFAPLFFVWLGYGMTPKIAMGALIAFFPILVGFLHGLELVDPSMRRFLATTGAPWRQVFLRVRLPWALRSTVAGCKVAIGLALIGAIVSEFVNASNGLGFLVKLGEDNFELEMQFSGIVAVSILGLLLYLVIDLLDVLFLSRFPPLRQREQD